MHYTIEKSGCSVRKGMVQVRYCLFLDADDARYEEHHVEVPVFPKEGYDGKTDVGGSPIDLDDYKKWKDGLPKKLVNNEFHNHFVQFEPDVTDEEINFVGQLALQLSYEKWEKGGKPHIVNMPVKFPFPYEAHITISDVEEMEHAGVQPEVIASIQLRLSSCSARLSSILGADIGGR